MKKNMILFLIILFLLANISFGQNISKEEIKDKHILIIYSSSILLPAMEDFSRSMNKELIESGLVNTNIHIEYIDKQYQKKENFEKIFREYINEKYSVEDIDVVVSVGHLATIWLNKDDNFKNASFVFMPLGLVDYEEIDSNKTGYFIESGSDAIKTIKESFKLIPDIKNIIIIHGDSSNEDNENKKIIDFINTTFPKVNVHIARNDNMDSLKEDLVKYSENTLGIYVSFFRDKEGNNYIPSQVLRNITDEVRFPIVSFYSSYLDYGILGGAMLSFSNEGERGAEYIINTFKNDLSIVEKIAPQAESIYDWRVLDSFNLNINKLPSYAKIVNRKQTIWYEYRNYVLSFLVIIFLLLGIIVLSVIMYIKKIDNQNKLRKMNTSLENLNAKLEEEIAEKELAREENYFLAMHDELTGLKNRRALIEDLSIKIDIDKTLSIALIDIDDFKNINDTRGHKTGDRILQKLSHLLLEKFGLEVYRVGGDEFAIILRNNLNKMSLHEELLDIIEEVKRELRNPYHLSVSIGVASCPKDSMDAVGLFKLADVALYEAKKLGKHRIEFYQKSFSLAFESEVLYEKMVRDIIKNDEFQVYYQPIVMNKSGDFKYSEALIRPTTKVFNPYEFIKTAEKLDLVSEVTNSIIKKVLNQLVLWREKGLFRKKVSINVSVNDFKGNWLVKSLKDNLEKYSVDPKNIEVEITENIILENHGGNIEKLNKIRELGIAVVLDDFGTGYSSLNYLTYLPIDKIKLDKSLKDRWLKYPYNELLQHLVKMAKVLKLEIVVEGVETEEEWNLLKNIDIDYLQGYLFDKPLPPKEMEKYLK